jgi:hypothetical protein
MDVEIKQIIVTEWVIFFNANSEIFQLYHGQNKLIFNEMMMRSAMYYTNTLCRHVAPLGHIILIPTIGGIRRVACLKYMYQARKVCGQAYACFNRISDHVHLPQ